MNALVEAARGGSIRAASRLIRCIEDDPLRACALLAEFGVCPSPRLIAGVTGAPGSGKSQLVSALIRVWRRRRPDERLGVLAVDPSSPHGGGAVLGDRVRMMEHATDDRVFIRSLASHGCLGGLTTGIRSSLRVMGLVGCQVVLLETVGVGQNEIEVAQAADLVIVVLAPGLGDSVQLLKSGLLEIADIVVVNKADRPGADRLFGELQAMLALGGGGSRRPLTFLVSAFENRGIEELVEGIEQVAGAREPDRAARRARSRKEEVTRAVRESALQMLDQALNDLAGGGQAIEQVLAGGASVEQAAAELIRAAAGQATPSRTSLAEAPQVLDRETLGETLVVASSPRKAAARLGMHGDRK